MTERRVTFGVRLGEGTIHGSQNTSGSVYRNGTESAAAFVSVADMSYASKPSNDGETDRRHFWRRTPRFAAVKEPRGKGSDIFLADGVKTATCLRAGAMLLCAKLLSEGQA